MMVILGVYKQRMLMSDIFMGNPFVKSAATCMCRDQIVNSCCVLYARVRHVVLEIFYYKTTKCIQNGPFVFVCKQRIGS